MALYGPENVLKHAKGLNLIQELVASDMYNCDVQELPYKVMGLKSKQHFVNLTQNKAQDSFIKELRELSAINALVEYQIKSKRYKKVEYLWDKYFGKSADKNNFNEFIKDMIAQKILIPTKIDKTIVTKDGTILMNKMVFNEPKMRMKILMMIYEMFTTGAYKMALLKQLTNVGDIFDPNQWVYESQEIFSLVLVVINILNAESTVRKYINFDIYPEDLVSYNMVAFGNEHEHCLLFLYDEATGVVTEDLMPIGKLLGAVVNNNLDQIKVKKNKIILDK